MPPGRKHSLPLAGALPAIGLLGLWTACFSLSALISTRPAIQTQARTQGNLADAVFGECRVVVSRYFYERADTYLHAGVPYLSKAAFTDSVYQDLQRRVSPSGHFHIERNRITEIMPWLWMSIRSDPSNAETYMVAAFWLERNAGRPDIALEVLRAAQAHVPFTTERLPQHYEIQFEKGRIHLKQGQLDAAARAFDAGLQFWKHAPDRTSDYARLLCSRLLLYRAILHEIDGDLSRAADHLAQYLEIKPNDAHIAQRLRDLRSGIKPELMASSLWRNEMKHEDASRRSCGREDADHGSCSPGCTHAH